MPLYVCDDQLVPMLTPEHPTADDTKQCGAAESEDDDVSFAPSSKRSPTRTNIVTSIAKKFEQNSKHDTDTHEKKYSTWSTRTRYNYAAASPKLKLPRFPDGKHQQPHSVH